MYCVVGSGPSGVACAQALLQQGVAVRMLDAGLELEPARARVVSQLAASAPGGWDPRLLAVVKEGMASNAKGVPLKLVYGSDFPYRGADLHLPGSAGGVGLKPSLAKGGLSNVWGGAMMPYIDRDLAAWPIDAARLAPHYAAVLDFTGLSAREDDLAAFFPLHTRRPGTLELSRQSRALLDRLERGRAVFAADGVHFGASRVALQGRRPGREPGCVYCGVCMYGCPYGYIYNSAATLEELRKNPGFTYEPDTIVRTLEENESGVTLRVVDRNTGEPRVVTAGRVFLAAGVIPTTRILLESRQLYGQTVWLKDSQYFLIPLLSARPVHGVRNEALHTLSQLFLEIFDSGISPNTIHLQIYSYNDLISGAVRQALGKLKLSSEFLVRQMEERLMVAQGYLHSDLSPRIAATLERGEPGASARLRLQPELNSQTRTAVRRVVGKLLRHAPRLGAIPLPPMVQITEPGRGFHSGGTFPMRQRPGPFESDLLGRPQGWTRVHAVDATVLPSIPATTITFSVMANAHRIGTETARLDEAPARVAAVTANPRVCLITGARGYLGGSVAAKFKAEGWEVVELVRRPGAEAVRAGRAIDFQLGDDLAPAALRQADALVHCAYDFTGRSWAEIEQTNVRGSQKLMSAARSGGVKSLVFISTMSAFAGCQSLYGRAKLLIENQAPAGTLRLRPGLIYGDAPRGMFGNLVAQVKKSRRVPIFGDGGQTLYLTHQADLCQTIFDFAKRGSPAAGVPVTAAHDQGWTFKQILQEIARARGKSLRFIRLPWRLVWCGIKTFELAGVPLSFRSDSLVSLMNQDAHPSFAATRAAAFKFRPFQVETLKL